jgi:hypothetical protein
MPPFSSWEKQLYKILVFFIFQDSQQTLDTIRYFENGPLWASTSGLPRRLRVDQTGQQLWKPWFL